MNESLKAIGDFCNTMGKGLHYITHPKELGIVLWRGIDSSSFYVCIIICLAAIVADMCGWEKGKKIAIGSPVVYVVIRMLSSGMGVD
jgi:hypothetical protein